MIHKLPFYLNRNYRGIKGGPPIIPYANNLEDRKVDVILDSLLFLNFKIFYSSNGRSDHKILFTSKTHASKRTSKLDPVLICFDDFYLRSKAMTSGLSNLWHVLHILPCCLHRYYRGINLLTFLSARFKITSVIVHVLSRIWCV